MPNYRIPQAAELLQVSDDTVRRWIELGKLSADKDESGRQVIDGKELAEFSVSLAQEIVDERKSQVTARNRFIGIVTQIQIEGLIAQVEIQSGPHHITSVITADAARELQLEVGSRAIATIKATNVGVEIS